MMSRFRRFLSDDRGGEALEYAIVTGLITVAAVTVIWCVGLKVLLRWRSVNSEL